MTTNHSGVTRRRATPYALQASTKEALVTALAGHDLAVSAYRRHLHKSGALHPDTEAALSVATAHGLLLADARRRHQIARGDL